MTQAAYPANGDVPPGTLFPFDARGQRNGKASVSADTRRLQQIQRELRQLTLEELKELRKDWSKPPLDKMAWIQALVPYLNGLIKERTLLENVARAKTPPQQLQGLLPKKPSGAPKWGTYELADVMRELAALREDVRRLATQFKTPPDTLRIAKPLPPPRQHAKGKKRRLIGPVGELAAVTRPWLDYAVAHPGKEITAFMTELRKEGIDPKRFQSSLSATASYFYGRRSMHTRLVQHILGGGQGVAFTFVGNPKPIRAPRRTDTQPASLDQSTPT